MTTAEEIKSKQAQAHSEKAQFTSLFSADGKLEEVRRIHRGNVRKIIARLIKLLLDEIRALVFQCGRR